MSNLQNALQQIREEHKHAELRVEKLDEVIRRLVGLNGSASAGKGARRRPHHVCLGSQADQPRTESAMGKSESGGMWFHCIQAGKRTISAAGRKRIAAAQRARWAKVRAANKKAA